jgi:hypothetical protein
MLRLRSVDKTYTTPGKGQGRHGNRHGVVWIFENGLGYQTISKQYKCVALTFRSKPFLFHYSSRCARWVNT